MRSGWQLTCEKALAGIASGQRLDAVGGVWNLIATVFDGNSVAANHIWQIGHSIGAIHVVLDAGLLRLALRILSYK